jgi:hypothetical protein
VAGETVEPFSDAPLGRRLVNSVGFILMTTN